MVFSQEIISDNHNPLGEKAESEIKAARYWNLSHIYVDETRAGMTWEYTTTNYD
ncbi:MAG: hypothetical protein ACFFG0_40595 [Candidatus Thorarchaeota archaeon]